MTTGKYGIRIKNIEAGTLYEYNNGVRDHFEYKNAMFTNSLFKDYLMENGLKLLNESSTRDIICLEFNFGSRSYEEEIFHLKKLAKAARTEYKLAKAGGTRKQAVKKKNKRQKIAALIQAANLNQKKYSKRSKEEIRKIFYNEGVNVEYTTRKRSGEITKREVIHYKMLYRSTGKAKKGSCMFIRDRLHKKAREFLYMGIRLPKDNPAIVEISAYAPLVSSTIVGKVKIKPENILILKDVERTFMTDVISVETDRDRHCIAKHIGNYTLKNTLFDGQALIDSRIFPEWGNGYILLRHHFCKMASFCCHIQKFFREYFGDKYENATVTDMFGTVHFVRDIELITTDNSMKWLKFDVPYESWCRKVHENGCMFGIVKTAHESKLGEVQKMSYQMVNSLDEAIMDNVTRTSIEYVNRLKQDNGAFLNYLQKNSNFSNDYEVLAALCRQNPDFQRSSYFRRRKEFIIKTYVLNLKCGKLIQDAENLVIVGSPYAMLLYAATGREKSVDDDRTFSVETGAVQCHTKRFGSGEYLAFFRSPFNSKNNLTYLHNVSGPEFDEYFEFGKQIIAVNLIGTDFQDRNNGSDQDSDSGYTTNQPDIVEHARKCRLYYPTIVNNIPKDKNVCQNTMDDFANLDNGLAKSQLDVGESSNLAQIAQTYACNSTDKKYSDYVCILSVLAQVAIDNAKRRFDIDLSREIKRIKSDMNIKKNKYPAFWQLIRKDFNKENINPELHCPMNCLYKLVFTEFRSNEPTLPMSHFFNKFEMDSNRKTCKKVEDLIAGYSLNLYDYNRNDKNDEEYLLLRSDFDELIREIQGMYLSRNYAGLFSWLIDRAFLISPQINSNHAKLNSTLNKNKSVLLRTLYNINSTVLLECFSKNT